MDLADSLTLIYRNNYKVVWNLALKFFYFTESILMKGLERQIVETSKNTFVFNKIGVNFATNLINIIKFYGDNHY